jgi:hypothetical protein
MSASNMNPFITYLFSHNGIDPQDSRKVSDFLHLTTEADILQITDAKLRGVPGLSAVYRSRIVLAARAYRRVHGLPQVDVLPSSQSNAPIQTKEEEKAEMQQLLRRLLQMVELM